MDFKTIIDLQKNEDDVLVDIKENVMYITLNREDRQNAMTTFMYSKITSSITSANSDPNI